MPANTAVIPLKAIYTNGDVTSLGELNSGDKLDPTFLDLSNYMQVSNVSSDYALSSTVGSNLANTNSYIATKADSTTVGSNLANTNAYIADTKSELWTAITSSNTSIRSYVDTEVAGIVDSAPSTLDTLNELAAALNDDANFASTVTTNLGQKLGATASVTLTGDVTGSGSFSSNAVSIALTDTNLGNTNAYIATKADSTTVGSNLANTNAYIASVNTTVGSNLANTNAYIATKEDAGQAVALAIALG